MHLVDTGAARDRCGSLAAVSRDHRDLNTASPKCLHHRRRFGLQGVGNREYGLCHAVHRDEHRRLAIGSMTFCLLLERADMDLFAGHQAHCTDQDPAAFNRCTDPIAGYCLKRVKWRQIEAPFSCRGNNRQSQRMLAAIFCGGSHSQHAVGITMQRMNVGKARAAFGQRAGLVENHGVDMRKRLQGLAFAIQYTKFGGTPATDHNRRRCRKSHCTRAGDNEHRDGADQCKGDRRVGTERQPGEERDDGDHDDHGREHLDDPVSQALDRQLRTLGSLDRADDLCEHRLFADLGGGDAQLTVLVHCAANHLIAGMLGGRDRFAGEHRLVDITLTLADFAVDRDTLAGTDHDHVAGLYSGYG